MALELFAAPAAGTGTAERGQAKQNYRLRAWHGRKHREGAHSSYDEEIERPQQNSDCTHDQKCPPAEVGVRCGLGEALVGRGRRGLTDSNRLQETGLQEAQCQNRFATL